MKYKKYKGDAYNIYTIKTDRFRNCHMEVVFYNKCKKENATKRALLCDLFVESTNKYPSKRELNIKLEELYNSYLYSVNTRIGAIISTNICFDFVNPKFLKDITLDDFLTFPLDVIMNPKIKNGEFDEEEIELIKNRLENEILSIKDNAKRLAIVNSLKKVNENAPFCIQTSGYLEDLKIITGLDIKKYYDEVIANDSCDIYIVGDIDMDEAAKIIRQNFNLTSIKNNKLDLYYDLKNMNKMNTIIEEEDIAQDQLILIEELKNLTEREKNITMFVYKGILSSTSLEAKLPKYLREKNSLCYSVSCLYFKYDSILLQHAGIDAKNFKKAVKISNNVLNDMKNGNISDEEFNNTKKSMLISLQMALDNDGSLINTYFLHNVGKVPLIHERIKQISSVTKDEVCAVAKKLKPRLVYLLRGEAQK